MNKIIPSTKKIAIGCYMRDIVADAIPNRGGTYEFINGLWYRVENTAGFYVSDPNGIENLPGYPYNNNSSITAVAMSFWAYTRDVAQRPTASGIVVPRGQFLGFWQDENGNWSIDRSHHFDRLNTAEQIAKANGQRAIFDVGAGLSITIED